MIKVTFNSFIFLRTPAASYEDYGDILPDELIKSEFFQAAIFFASESLYAELRRNEFNYQALDKKVKISIQKYFNRMCFRPTPFGLFSACSPLEWDVSPQLGNCTLSDEKLFYVNPDFQFSTEIGRVMEESNAFEQVKYYTNSAIYSIRNEKRYLASRFDEARKKNDFFINSFHSDRILGKLFSFCRNGRTKFAIKEWLATFVNKDEDLSGYIGELIAEGLLVSELSPNMSGRKYFDRLVDIAQSAQPGNDFAKQISAHKQAVDRLQNDKGMVPDVALAFESQLYQQYQSRFKSMFYVGFERPVRSSLDTRYQSLISDGLNCLAIISEESSPQALMKFKNKFRTRFEDQEIPLLQAIDREAGIGYEGSESNFVTSELLDGVQLDMKPDSLNFNWTPIHEFFLSRFLRVKDDESITIADGDLEKFVKQPELKAPPSFSVVFRTLGDRVWIEQAGGCTATALLGRFTLFNERFLNEAKQIAEVEAGLNPGVIFAEVSCFNDEHAANINSNAGIWTFEIPIGVYSALRPENIIGLSDIMVSVVDNNIVLRSKKLNKIIIPRLSSAYNYSRSELSVFRFLCDMQYQGLKYNFNLDLKKLLPGLGYYPRVEYKKCILSPATWMLNAEDLLKLTSGNAHEEFAALSASIRLKQYFALTEGDNQLFFDSNNPDSVSLFLNVIKNKKTAQLQEVFFDRTSMITDTKGKPFVAQFIASVFSEQQIYSSGFLEYIGTLSRKKNKIKRIYLPGDEWIYLKIYCHPAISNSILVKNIRMITAHLKKKRFLKSWFFVRYADPEAHLRIRMRIDPEGMAEALKYLKRQLKTDVEKGSVNNLSLDTYKREIERYGADTMEIAEMGFYMSSELIVNYIRNLRKEDTAFSEIHLALLSVNEIVEIFFQKISDRITILRRMHEGMSNEFERSKQVKLQMDNKYREYAGFINNMKLLKAEIIALAGKREFNSFIKELHVLKLSSRWFLTDKQMKLAADLIHMHLNRTFNDNQRKHEFVIYYMLQKYYLSLAAREHKQKSTLSVAPQGFRIDEVEKAVFK